MAGDLKLENDPAEVSDFTWRKPRTKLVLLIPHLGGGGAERVLANLARYLDPASFEIHLVLFVPDLPGAIAPPAWVHTHRFERKRVRNGWRPLLTLLRKLKPDVILSGMAHLNFLVLLLKPALPRHTAVLVRQNTTASSSAEGWFGRLAYRLLYPLADAIVCQSESMARDLVEYFAVPESKLRVLANPIDVEGIRTSISRIKEPSPWPEGAWPRVLCVGRLAYEKGFDLMLRAIASLKPTYPQLHAILIGEGRERQALEELARDLQLDETVTFSGHRTDIAPFYSGATLFVLPSRYEGMPNALLESAAAGLPLVATPCCEGVVQLLEDAPGAWLSEHRTAESLAECMAGALEQLAALPVKARRFEHRFIAPFEAGIAIEAYASMLKSFANNMDQVHD